MTNITIKNMQNSYSEEFIEHVQLHLQHSDPQSYRQIEKFFSDQTEEISNPFSVLMQKLSGRSVPEKEAINFWHKILENKSEMEKKLNRRVGIQTATVDFLEQRSDTSKTAPPLSKPKKEHDEWLRRVYSPGYHLEKLKEETLRSKRYKHALSAIMLDVDEFHLVNEKLSYGMGDKILTIIVKIIRTTIRNVDILSRYSGDRFFIILPNTNRREAAELAERLREKVNQRTKRIEGLSDGVTLTLSAGQYSQEISSNDFMRQMEHTLIEGKRNRRNSVYLLQ
ncbi:diguanylate cyclase [Chitinispirillum alkaliphilum]|nr:diguanylate cyclase [Chitinispirillum alkaliphilum]